MSLIFIDSVVIIYDCPALQNVPVAKATANKPLPVSVSVRSHPLNTLLTLPYARTHYGAAQE